MHTLAKALALVLVTATAALAQVQPPDTPQQTIERRWPPVVYLNDLGCAPHLTFTNPTSKLHISGSTAPDRHLVFATGQTVTIDGGTSAGVEAGQEYFVRRLPRRFGARGPDFDNPLNVHTVGWVKIVSVESNVATAKVTHICDAMMAGDYLEPFAAPVTHAILDGDVRYDNLARLLGGDEDRSTIGINQYMTMDRGSDHGLRPGTRIVVLRDKKEGALVEIGEGIVLQVRPETSTVQITRARDAVYTGDLAAIAR
jgi:hypothetical protein